MKAGTEPYLNSSQMERFKENYKTTPSSLHMVIELINSPDILINTELLLQVVLSHALARAVTSQDTFLTDTY